VGEPYNSLAVRARAGRVLATSHDIWNHSPEKVFAVSEEWAAQHPRTHHALLLALLEAAQWLDAPENRAEAVDILASGEYVNAPPDVIRLPLQGAFQYAHNEFPRALPGLHVFHRHAANFPWRSHALWLLTQMLRWGHLQEAADLNAVASQVYRPDLYRAAATERGIAAPGCDCKPEGGHDDHWQADAGGTRLRLGADRFLDGRHFDPADPVAYLRGFGIHRLAPEAWAALAAANPPRDPPGGCVTEAAAFAPTREHSV
jgi:nitrate/nitrite transport system substrate-binding protein